MTPPNKTLSYFLKFLLLFFTVCISLLAIEIGLRLCAPRDLDQTLQQQLDYAERFSEGMKQQATVMKVIDPLF